MKNIKKLLITAALLTLVVTIGTTVAFMTAKTGSVNNEFAEADIKISTVEEFDEDSNKTSIKVKNTSTGSAFVRVKLVSYWINSDNEIVAGSSPAMTFALSSDWISAGNNVYYYKKPLDENEITSNLIGSGKLELIQKDGLKQVVEVLASAIQCVPEEMVESMWGVTVTNGEIVSAGGNN